MLQVCPDLILLHRSNLSINFNHANKIFPTRLIRPNYSSHCPLSCLCDPAEISVSERSTDLSTLCCSPGVGGIRFPKKPACFLPRILSL